MPDLNLYTLRRSNPLLIALPKSVKSKAFKFFSSNSAVSTESFHPTYK